MKTLKLASFGLLMLIQSALTLNAQNVIPARTFGEQSLLQDFLCSEVTYPETALESGTEGTVVISFKVTEKGDVDDVKVKESISPELDAEALRLFSLLLWEPAFKLGSPVASVNEFEVPFSIKKYNKHCKQRGYVKSEYLYEPIDSSLNVHDVKAVDKAPYALFSDKTMTLSRFLNTNIRYPETAYRQNISGKVRLLFVVEPQGRISNIKVIEPVSGGCTQEAIRLLQLIHWMPGIRDGYAVRTFMNLDINFKLPEDSDMKMFENTQMNSN